MDEEVPNIVRFCNFAVMKAMVGAEESEKVKAEFQDDHTIDFGSLQDQHVVYKVLSDFI